MTVDMRREASHIFKQMNRMQRTIGESVIWFLFDMGSTYDRVYDEGNRTYLPGVLVPVLWIDQVEDPERYAAEGRRPTQRLRTAMSARDITETLGAHTEAHGGRRWDIKPVGKPWWNDRNNDLLYYDGRFYEIANFQIRGRAQEHDVVIGVSGIETQEFDERLWDIFPGNMTWS
jgi:hypothetical protein